MNNNELTTLLHDNRTEVAHHESSEAGARARLYAEFHREAKYGKTAPRAAEPGRPRSFWPVAATGFTAVAAAVAAAVALVSGPLANRSADDLAHMSTAQVLVHAADTLERNDPGRPGDKQWIYTKTVHKHADVDKSWTRFDGKRRAVPAGSLPVPDRDGDGLTIMPGTNGPSERTPAEDYDFFGRLPTDPDKLREHLYQDSTNKAYAGEMDADDQTFESVYDMFEDMPYLPAKNQAALYRALATIDDVEVDRNVTDAAGRPGIAVSHTRNDGYTLTLILNKQDYRVVALSSSKSGVTTGGSAIVEQKVVDKPGEG